MYPKFLQPNRGLWKTFNDLVAKELGSGNKLNLKRELLEEEKFLRQLKEQLAS
jgi:hypothetical protein